MMLWLYEIYRSFIARPLKRLAHHYSFLKPLNRDYDWDSHGIFELLHHKLTRLTREMGKHGVFQTNHQKALRIAIKLSKRLKEDDYNAAYNRYEKKWGILIQWFTETDNDTFTWHTTRSNITNDFDKQQERQDFVKAMDVDAYQKERDRKIFFNVLNKYMLYWWD